MVEEKAEDDTAGEFGYVNSKDSHLIIVDIPAGLIFTTSIFALPLALAAFPQRQAVQAKSLEEHFWDKGGKDGKVEFNRGI